MVDFTCSFTDSLSEYTVTDDIVCEQIAQSRYINAVNPRPLDYEILYHYILAPQINAISIHKILSEKTPMRTM